MKITDINDLHFLLADDHSLIRQGIQFLIEDINDSYKTTLASTVSQTLDIVHTNKIDIAIIDAHFPDGNSINILKEIKATNPEVKILIFSGIDEIQNALKYINAGANGFLSKMNEEDDIKTAIETLITTGKYLSTTTQDLLLNSFGNKSNNNPLLLLSQREMQVAEMYAKGLGNLEISNILDLKQNTTSTIKKRIFDKLKISNVIELTEIIKLHQ